MFEQTPTTHDIPSSQATDFESGDRLDFQKSTLKTVQAGLERASLMTSATHEKEAARNRHEIVGQYGLTLAEFRRLEKEPVPARSEYDLAA